MASFRNFLTQLDQGIAGFFGQWNTYTTVIVSALVGLITFQLLTHREPDIHPQLLARQASAAPVREAGESSVYRSHAAPHGMPLNPGLNIKDAGTSKWSKGRDGDLRDIWRQALNGVLEEGPNKGKRGTVLTVLGMKVVEHRLEDITRQINLVGQHMLDQGAVRVGIYLPNSVELVAALFACAFYNLTAVILSFGQPEDAVINMLQRAAVDTVVTTPGAFPFDAVVKSYPAVRQLIWVVDEGNKHLDWSEVPKGVGGSVIVSIWQDIVSEAPASAGQELPRIEGQGEPRDVTVFWTNSQGEPEEMVRFTSANIVSSIAAQIFALPTSERMGPADLFLPADSLANMHTMILTLTALYCNASVALNAVSSQAESMAVATRGIAPTVVVASPSLLLKQHAELSGKMLDSVFGRARHWLRSRTLTESGAMVPPAPGKLRIIYAAERAKSTDGAMLSSSVLGDLRALTGSRVVYAFTAPKVAGAVAQNLLYDYRVFSGLQTRFGPPLTSTEILLRDKGEHRTTETEVKGEIIVRGPCVAGSEAALGVLCVICNDNTLAYL